VISEAHGRVRIVPITLDLVEGFHAVLDAVARERRWLAMVEAPPLEDARKFVQRVLDRNDVQLLALDGERVVGWCDIVRRSGPGFEHAGIVGMGLLPEYRGGGLGARLLEEAMSRARAAGIERIELGVWNSNEPARRLYQKLGFQTEGVQRRGRLLDGVADDLVLMAKIEPPKTE
jgi:ribosomal protein S18 acetylase RimI-like enzyme